MIIPALRYFRDVQSSPHCILSIPFHHCFAFHLFLHRVRERVRATPTMTPRLEPMLTRTIPKLPKKRATVRVRATSMMTRKNWRSLSSRTASREKARCVIFISHLCMDIAHYTYIRGTRECYFNPQRFPFIIILHSICFWTG